jgi:hypothetical protein
LWPGLTHGW